MTDKERFELLRSAFEEMANRMGLGVEIYLYYKKGSMHVESENADKERFELLRSAFEEMANRSGYHIILYNKETADKERFELLRSAFEEMANRLGYRIIIYNKETENEGEEIFEICSVNKYLLSFFNEYIINFESELNPRNRKICQSLMVKKISDVAENYGISRERVRQIFSESIRKIINSYDKTIRENEQLKTKNDELARRIFLLEEDIKNSTSKENVKDIAAEEEKLCSNAKKMLSVPVIYLPLLIRTINILRSLDVKTFKELPLLSKHQLRGAKGCGKRTIQDIEIYLANFSLKLGMRYQDVLMTMQRFKDREINLDNLVNRRGKKWL